MDGRPSISPLVALGFALFTDAFFYEVVVPLVPLSPAGTTSFSDIALLYCGYSLGVVLLTPLCGILSDRIGRKNPLIVGAIAQLVEVYMFAKAGSFWMLMFGRIIQGGAAAATWTAGLAVIAERYPSRRVQKMGLAAKMQSMRRAASILFSVRSDMSGFNVVEEYGQISN